VTKNIHLISLERGWPFKKIHFWILPAESAVQNADPGKKPCFLVSKQLFFDAIGSKYLRMDEIGLS